jgi:hypothetical protein
MLTALMGYTCTKVTSKNDKRSSSKQEVDAPDSDMSERSLPIETYSPSETGGVLDIQSSEQRG